MSALRYRDCRQWVASRRYLARDNVRYLRFVLIAEALLDQRQAVTPASVSTQRPLATDGMKPAICKRLAYALR